ncbi:MAG: hypothetical protein KDK78_00820 [Chlamydiia bacterium]|nr:hypothetical protein [Chlamydiia bacterium]
MSMRTCIGLPYDSLCKNVHAIVSAAEREDASLHNLTCTQNHELLDARSPEGRLRRMAADQDERRCERLMHTVQATAALFPRFLDTFADKVLTPTDTIPDETQIAALKRLGRLRNYRDMLPPRIHPACYERIHRLLTEAGCTDEMIQTFNEHLCFSYDILRQKRFETILHRWSQLEHLASDLHLKLDAFQIAFNATDLSTQAIADDLASAAFQLLVEGRSDGDAIEDILRKHVRCGLEHSVHFRIFTQFLTLLGADQAFGQINPEAAGLKVLGTATLQEVRDMQRRAPEVMRILDSAGKEELAPLLKAIQKWRPLSLDRLRQRCTSFLGLMERLRNPDRGFSPHGKSMLMLALVQGVAPGAINHPDFRLLAHLMEGCVTTERYERDDFRLPESFAYETPVFSAWATHFCRRKFGQNYQPANHDTRLLLAQASYRLERGGYSCRHLMEDIRTRSIHILPPRAFVDIPLRRQASTTHMEVRHTPTSWAYSEADLDASVEAYLSLALGFEGRDGRVYELDMPVIWTDCVTNLNPNSTQRLKESKSERASTRLVC